MLNAELANMYRQLATLFNAGMPILRSLEIIVEGERGRLKKVFSAMAEEVGRGSQIHEAMAKRKKVFGPFDIALVEAGEFSGNLTETMKMLAKWYEFRQSMVRRLISGLTLPVFILHVGIFLGSLPFAILGKITWNAFFVYVLSAIMWLWAAFFVIFWLVKLSRRRQASRRALDAFVLWIPLLGRSMRHMAYGRFCSSFSMLYGSGVPIIDAAKMAVDMSSNAKISPQFEGAAASVAAGNSMHEGFSKSLPMQIRNLWEVGEESGELDKASQKLGDMYMESSSRWFSEFVFWLPRLIYFAVMAYMAIIILRNAGAVFSSIGYGS
jgi:type IV pilus assembly protein PilC